MWTDEEIRNQVISTSLMFQRREAVRIPWLFVMMPVGILTWMIPGKTVDRTLIHKMVTTMITRPYELTRAIAREWPIFAEDDLSGSAQILSIEVHRRVDESVAAAVEDAASLLVSALGASLRGRDIRTWLVALGEPISRQNRLAVSHAERDLLWMAQENSGIKLPSGHRKESQISPSPTSLQFGGSIELTSIDDLPVALEVTRLKNAMVLCGSGSNAERDLTDLLETLIVPAADSKMLLRASVRQVGNGRFAARSFGLFDDVEVGVEVFAEGEILNGIEHALAVT